MYSNHFSRQLDRHFLNLDENQIGTESEFVKRTARKIAPLIFLKALCLTICYNSISYTQIALLISIWKTTTVSKQAVAKRIGKPIVEFCKTALTVLLSKQLITTQSLPLLSEFNRVLVQDSTSIQLPQRLASKYPGSRNRFGIQYAIAKIQAIIDLKSNNFLHLKITPFIKNDQSVSADIVSLLQKGDLVVRDLGYFVLSVFQKIINKGAFFISRSRHDVILFDNSFKRIDLLKRLKRCASFDQWVYLGAQDKIRVRIIAIPLTKQIADERRRKLVHNRDRRLNPSKSHLALCSWAIFITNVSEDVWPAEKIKAIYKLRWRIEIVFKSWKSNFNLDNIDSVPNQYLSEALMFSKLIYILIFNTVLFVPLLFDTREQTRSQVSVLKLAAIASNNLIFDLFSLNQSERIVLLKYFCSYEKRKKRDNYFQLLKLS